MVEVEEVLFKVMHILELMEVVEMEVNMVEVEEVAIAIAYGYKNLELR